MIRSMKVFAALLLSIFMTGLLCGNETQGFKYGDRPSDSVFDPAGLLSSTQRSNISNPLRNILTDEGIDVMVIVLPDIGDAPPGHVARAFDEKWSKTDISAVVLHVPGAEGAPWIFPGEAISDVIRPEVLGASVIAAEKRAAAEPDEPSKIRAASIEAADVMRYWTGSAVIRTESIVSERQARLNAYGERRRLIKLSAMVAAAGAIPIIAGLGFFFSQYQSRKPRVFPPVRKIPRLGAPYAGGNNATSRIR